MRAAVGWVVIFASALSGCAPVVSGVQVVQAKIELESAETAGARTLAPYEYTAAAEYLHKAREEAGYSDFLAARNFALKAEKLAKEAREKALAAPAPGKGTTPAKPAVTAPAPARPTTPAPPKPGPQPGGVR
jgi:hypothetical protein